MYKWIIAITLLLAACSDGDGTSVPRRTAYPRIALYDTTYVEVAGLPTLLSVNSNTSQQIQRRDDGAYWVTITYPAYKAYIYLTLTPANEANISQIVANRTERIDLNVANTPTSVDSDTNPDEYTYNIVYSPSMHTTPIHLLAYKTHAPQWVVSGSVYFPEASTSVSLDSISPVYQAIKQDIHHTFSHLCDNR